MKNYNVLEETMDDEMDLFVDEIGSFLSDDDNVFVDENYEFDACQFYDFNKDETQSEADEADTWFCYAHEYPPSPFVVKLKMMKAAKAMSMKGYKTSSTKKETHKKTSTSSTSSSISDGDIDHKAAPRDLKCKGVKHYNHIPQDITKAKSKSTVNVSKPNGSSFMKPTASHLAKQSKECDIHSGSSGRLQKPLISASEKLQSPIRSQNHATKRQKLEIGYLRKAAQLKHQASFLHKATKKAELLEGKLKPRVKTITPQKPALVTEERAQRRRSQNKSESVQQPKAFKARPLNRKILDTPTLPQRKKSMTPTTEFQEFHLKTNERAMQVQPTNVLRKHSTGPAKSEDTLMKSQNSGNAGKKDKCRSPNNFKACSNDKVYPIKDGGYTLNTKHNSYSPPVELFKKLSLKPESETKTITSLKPPRVSKGLKENMARSFQQDFRRCVGKPNHCGTDRRTTEVKI
uniref:protein TPX2-like n=1 Tax=Erigeron canadensis TaxID=72917 RepID=UPI001CB8D8D9|nr:protein TPX2-like [Erigeron canadensis]XP_043617463.1 protein TPX2-like [Erigeron canadensis]